MQTLKADATLAFMNHLQTLFYRDGLDISDLKIILDAAQAFTIDRDQFESLYISDEMTKQTSNNFEKVKAMGVNSFPTLLLYDQDFYPITMGYQRFEKMKQKIESMQAIKLK